MPKPRQADLSPVLGDDSVFVWRSVYLLYDAARKRFGLPRIEIRPTLNDKEGALGRCWHSERAIGLRLHASREHPEVPFRLVDLIDTLAHELAHFKVWSHGPKHRALTAEIVNFWRERGLI